MQECGLKSWQGEISSFAGFIKAFCRQSGPNDHEKWIVIVENFKLIYVTPNPIEEVVSPPLVDDEVGTKEGCPDLKEEQF